jgi:lipid A 3-O-deacylase
MQGWVYVRSRLVPIAFAFIAACLYGRPSLAAEGMLKGSNGDPALLTVGVGSIGNIVTKRDDAVLFSAEYRFGPKLELFYVRPSLGIITTTDKSIYGYFCLSGDIYFGPRIVLTPQAAVGGYSAGDGQDLGGILEFKTGATLSWRFDNRSRIGIGFHHISNANIYDHNPGTELLTAYYSHPINF